MAIENRDFGWLRRTLCDEIEAVRAGTADHTRAKSVAALAAVALKSVEVEALVRQQHAQFEGQDVPALGVSPLCEAAPALEAHDEPEGEPQRGTPAPRFVAGKSMSGGGR